RGFARIERRPRAVTVGCTFEQLYQGLMSQQCARAATRMQVELRKNMPSKAGQMDICPILVPVDFVWLERMPRGVGWGKCAVELADIAAVESIREFLDIGPINFDQRACQLGAFPEAGDALLESAGHRRALAGQGFG